LASKAAVRAASPLRPSCCAFFRAARTRL
jgi:hypothetical protein